MGKVIMKDLVLMSRVEKESRYFKPVSYIADPKGGGYLQGGIDCAWIYGEYLLVLLKREQGQHVIEIFDASDFSYCGETELLQDVSYRVSHSGVLYSVNDEKGEVARYQMNFKED